MPFRWITILSLSSLVLSILLGSAIISAEPPAAAKPKVDFATQIQPILTRRCHACHGPKKRESNYRLDVRELAFAAGDFGDRAIIPSKADDSPLLRYIAGSDDDGIVMPPEDDGEMLTAAEIALVRNWIEQGAHWPDELAGDATSKLTTDHWSFQPVQKVAPPQLDSPWIRNGIDAFVLRKLEENKMSHSGAADRRTLIRRIHLDMLGLPPTPEQVEAFVNDPSPGAYGKLVEAVLESPHYGERWARYWLDLVRFAETHGFETNRERPNAWPYRDYVIQSLNDDVPYDQFIKEQIAGDALGNPVATGYLVAGPYDLVKSPDISLSLTQRQNELDDIINTTGSVFLGMTIGCTRCHNHKFDPLTQTDYYAMQAVFAGVQHGDRALPASPNRQALAVKLDSRIGELRGKLGQLQQTATELVASAAKPALREAVSPRHNIERITPVDAKFVRFTVLATNTSEPCLDELEVFSADKDVALASAGAQASCSSSLPGHEIHKLEHINDGKYGNGRSWISNEKGAGWVQVEFAQVSKIDRIEWGRDREGKYSDRLATIYRIEVSQTGEAWQTVASSSSRLPFSGVKSDQPIYRFDHLPPDEAKAGRKLLDELKSAEAQRDRLAATLTVYAGKFSQPGPTHRLYRGEPMAKRELVGPDAPEVFTELALSESTPEQQRRKQLAQWIASPENPLTARVIVNRLWQFHFGRGFVGTPSDFGAAGTAPTHPELLDWLASQLVANNWSLKQMHRLILQSATYRQSGRPDPVALKADAGTQLWWRFPPRRLEAEPIRDSILSVTGMLDLRMGGPGFSAFEVEAENVRHYHPKSSYGPEDWRRMIYMTKVRMEQDSVFGLFDCPDAATSVPQRSRSTTPLQALNLFNSTFLLQQSELFARRLRSDCPDDNAAQIARAFELCYARSPEEAEATETLAFVQDQGLPAFCRALLNSNEFLFMP
jgi:hypothetical protein